MKLSPEDKRNRKVMDDFEKAVQKAFENRQEMPTLPRFTENENSGGSRIALPMR